MHDIIYRQLVTMSSVLHFIWHCTIKKQNKLLALLQFSNRLANPKTTILDKKFEKHKANYYQLLV